MDDSNIKDAYNDYIEVFKQLPNEEKRKEIIDKVKDLIATMEKFSTDIGINHELLLNREMVDLNQQDVSESDYLEGLFAYLITLEETLGESLLKIAPFFYK